jgi:hypothetical protein
MPAYHHSRARRLHRQHEALGWLEAQNGIVEKGPEKLAYGRTRQPIS